MTSDAAPKRHGWVSDLLSGLATGLFNVPAVMTGFVGGMALLIILMVILQRIRPVERFAFPATARVLDAENRAWDAAQAWLQQRTAGRQAETTAE